MAPSRRPDPAPLETNDVALITAGTGAWLLALVVLAVLKLAGTDVRTWWLVMCAEGAALGLVGIRYCRRRRDAIARDRSAG